MCAESAQLSALIPVSDQHKVAYKDQHGECTKTTGQCLPLDDSLSNVTGHKWDPDATDGEYETWKTEPPDAPNNGEHAMWKVEPPDAMD